MSRPRRGTRRSRTRGGGQEEPAPTIVQRCPLSGKRRYVSEDAALEAAFEFSMNHGFRLSSRSAYRCVGCGDWHLTGG